MIHNAYKICNDNTRGTHSSKPDRHSSFIIPSSTDIDHQSRQEYRQHDDDHVEAVVNTLQGKIKIIKDRQLMLSKDRASLHKEFENIKSSFLEKKNVGSSISHEFPPFEVSGINDSSTTTTSRPLNTIRYALRG